MKKVENKEKTPTKSHNKLRDTRKTFTTTPQRKPVNQAKVRKEAPQFAWIENTYGHPAKKAMAPGKDEWIGNL